MTYTFDFIQERFDYLLARGKGISVFNATVDLVDQFNDQVLVNTNSTLYRCSSIITGSPVHLPSSPAIVTIFQDLPITQFQDNASILADRLFFPLWFKGISIAFFSCLGRSIYNDKTIESADLHKSIHSINNFLLKEQIMNLLERVNYQFHSPEFLNLPLERSIYTPIEKAMADTLEKRGLSYKPQVKLGKYVVDFLVDCGSRKVVVECDGSAYHDPLKDQERDKALSIEGYPIHRFSGSEINQNALGCIDRLLRDIEFKAVPSYKLDEDLDKSQLKAVQAVSGPVRVLAPAGSGKTKTLVNRIYYLLNQGIREEEILALAFNKKAKEEMQNRLGRRGVYEIDVRTFHSLGFEIIRESLGWRFHGDQQSRTAKKLMRKAINKHTSLPARRNKDPLDLFMEGLRKAKMELPPIDQMVVEFENKLYPFEGIFQSYLEEQTRANFMTFDDMIYLAVRVLIKNDQIREKYQEKSEYILVDEYQDLNQAQLIMLQILALPQNNIFAVGDDDQLIYGWRGAEVRQIVDFDRRFPLSESYVLNTNYRSSMQIVKHSQWLIEKNEQRVLKEINPREGAQEGSFLLQHSQSILEQAVEAVNWLTEHKKANKRKWSDYAFLYRFNAMQFPLAVVLDAKQIPHSPLLGQHIFETRAGEDLLSYLQITLYPQDATFADYSRVLNRPNKYLKNEIIQSVKNWDDLKNLILEPGLRDWERENIIDFVTRLEYLQAISRDNRYNSADYVYLLVNESGLLAFYMQESTVAEETDSASEDIMLKVLMSLAENFSRPEEFFQYAIKEKENTFSESEYGGNGFHDDHNKDEVYLSTIHKSKGKEFPNVVYFNLNSEGECRQGADLEEERRVAYVGATRAISDLMITFSSNDASRFVSELSMNPAFWLVGDGELLARLEKIKNKSIIVRSKYMKLKSNVEVVKQKLQRKNEAITLRSNLLNRLIPRGYHHWRIRIIVEKLERKTAQLEDYHEQQIIPLEDMQQQIEEELQIRNCLPKKEI